MSQITDKYSALQKQHVDLGADLHPGAPDIDAGYGGKYRQYANGNIYFHPNAGTEAHEVHGGILSLYQAHGGPGVDPTTGKRLFGFPRTDELRSANNTPVSEFETGAVFWTPGTGGAVITGAVWEAFRQLGGQHEIGLPLTSNMPVAGGEAVIAERGLVWSNGTISVLGRLSPPLLGTPLILDPSPRTRGPVLDPGHMMLALRGVGPGGIAVPPDLIQPSLGEVIRFEAIPQATFDALTKADPVFFATLWLGLLSVVPTGAGQGGAAARIPLDAHITAVRSTSAGMDVTCELAFRSSDAAKDNTLYDLMLALPGNRGSYPLSPHCLFLKKDWSDFGLLHITDLHLSLRNEGLRARLNALGLNDSAAQYANCQDTFRNFIKYANHLHSIGLAHAVMATGDLVDYIAEEGDDPYGLGNFARLRNMLLGLPFDTGVVAGEELLLPIFTTFGNHDHRLYPYDLHCKLSIEKNVFEAAVAAALVNPVIGGALALIGAADEVYEWVTGDDKLGFDVAQYGTFNLKESDADKLQGGVPTYSAGDFDKPLNYLKQSQDFSWWNRYFGSTDNKVALGPHRLVLLDSGGDAGVPASASPEALPGILLNYLDGDLPRDTFELATGCPNSVGYSTGQLGLIRDALQEAGANGLVIVGVHLPPIAPTKGYNDYFRETEHPSAPAALTNDYLGLCKLPRAGWSIGAPWFAAGPVAKKLDFGISVGNADVLLQLCAGQGAARPIDLLLCGHHHDRIEYRIRWDRQSSQVQYFMDFYTENPGSFSQTVIPQRHELPGVGDIVSASPSPSAGAGPGAPVGSTGAGNLQRSLTTYSSTDARIRVDPKAKVGGEQSDTSEVYGNGPPIPIHVMRVPPYADPLNSSADAGAWWQAHRPLLMQTAALGPIDPCQRFDTPTYKEPTFQGFRLIQVKNGIIQKIRYVLDRELTRTDYKLPWEGETGIGPDQHNTGASPTVTVSVTPR